MQPFDWHTAEFRAFQRGIAAKREAAIRAGALEPLTVTERRWAAEGPRPIPQLESGTNPATEGEQA